MARMSSGERMAQAEECLASGLSARDWCAERGEPAATTCAWLRRLREERACGLAPAFVEVAPCADPPRAGVPIVCHVGGVELVLPSGFAEADAAAAMRA